MSTPPNIIVIMSDQMKATASHLWGNPNCFTPALERLAAEGVRYENAYTPHPLCVPARVSLWTAQYPHMHGARRNETLMPADAVHAFKLWKAAGYTCGLIGKNHCFNEESDIDLFDVWNPITHTGFEPYTYTRGMPWYRSTDGIKKQHEERKRCAVHNPRFDFAVTDFPLEDYSTGLIAGQTRHFLREKGANPFALWVSFPDPHEPWVAPRQYADMFPPEDIMISPQREVEFDANTPERNRVLYEILGTRGDPEAHIRGVMSVYYAMVRFMDDAIGQIMEELETLGLRENTIVVFCADHGDFMGEHHMQCKGGVFYDCLTHIPMIVSWPGHIPEGMTDDSMVNLVDIVPTLLALQDLEQPRSMVGAPLPTVTDAPARNATWSEYGAGGPAFTLGDLHAMNPPTGRKALMQSLRWREAEGRRKMVRTRQWKYVHDAMGDTDELYDLLNDPWELTNVVDVSEHRTVLCEMQRLLLDWSLSTEDSPPVPLPDYPETVDHRLKLN